MLLKIKKNKNKKYFVDQVAGLQKGGYKSALKSHFVLDRDDAIYNR